MLKKLFLMLLLPMSFVFADTKLPEWLTTADSYYKYKKIINYDVHDFEWAINYCKTNDLKPSESGQNLQIIRYHYEVAMPIKTKLYHYIYFNNNIVLGDFLEEIFFNEDFIVSETVFEKEDLTVEILATKLGDYYDKSVKVLNSNLTTHKVTPYITYPALEVIYEFKGHIEKTLYIIKKNRLFEITQIENRGDWDLITSSFQIINKPFPR